MIERFFERVAMLLGAMFLASVLASCGASDHDPAGGAQGSRVSDTIDERVGTVTIKRQDGRTVECAVLENYNAGGLSCDWAGSR